MEDEIFAQQLGGGMIVYTSRAHSFGTDAILLARFSEPKSKELACDLGTGCGIIPLVWAKTGGPKRTYALELQEMGILQLKHSIQDSPIEDGRIIPVLGDIRSLPEELPKGVFDLVTCNPPYYEGNGIVSQTMAAQIARHELTCGILDVCMAASKLLKFGGKLCLCQKPERLCDVFMAMRSCNIEPKRLKLVQKNVSAPPWLFLVSGKKGAKPGLRVEPELILYEGEHYTEEFEHYYR